MNMPIVEFSSVQISLGVASGSPCAALPLALLYATTRWQSPVWTVSPSRRNTFTPVVVILLQYRSQSNGHLIVEQLENTKTFFFYYLLYITPRRSFAAVRCRSSYVSRKNWVFTSRFHRWNNRWASYFLHRCWSAIRSCCSSIDTILTYWNSGPIYRP
jgi:hypothetical protein